MYNNDVTYYSDDEEEYKNCILNIDKFLDDVNHNVRNSINNIIGTTDLILMGNINTEQKQNLNLIKSNTLNLLNLLNDAIDFFKIQSCNMKIEKLEFDFKDFVKDIIKLSNKEVIHNDIKFEIDIAPNIPQILIGDSYRLKQVLISIIKNVIKFTKHGIISFVIEIIGNFQRQIDLRFKIKTSSTVFCKNDILKLSKSFTGPNGKSHIDDLSDSVIDLYISKEIVKIMGGQMEVVSKNDIGTAFSFDLTLEVSKRSSLIDTNLSNKIENNIITRKLNFLVVGKDEVSGSILCKLLKKHGYICTLIDNRNEILGEVQNKKYDVILVNMQFSTIKDIQLVKTIRKLEKKNGTYTPIIALMTHEPRDDRQKFLNAGVDKYICKPFDVDELIKLAYRIAKSDKDNSQFVIEKHDIYEDSLFLYPL